VPLFVLGLALGCVVAQPPIVSEKRFYPTRDALRKVAVVPFTGKGIEAQYVELVERHVTEELVRSGVKVIPATELRIAFRSHPRGATPTDVPSVARVAVDDFRATSILIGHVTRFRDRVGDKYGAETPASVAFRVTLHGTPTGRKLWTGLFDETQVSLSADPRRARRYPGGGTRWLTGPQLANFGARAAAQSLAASR
jgi:hypothetical protein